MPQRSRLSRTLERMAALAAPHQHDLVRGMVAELDSIADPAERRRFALGAGAAIVRLAVRGYRGTAVHTPSEIAGVSAPENAVTMRGPSMPTLATRTLLRRLATAFAVACVTLTALMLTHYAVRLSQQLSPRGAPAGTIVEALLLGVPFMLAMTVPMAVFLAVSWLFTRLAAEGVLASAQRERHGLRRLIAPVVGAAAVIGTLMFVSNSLVVPRTNARLAAVLTGSPPRALSDRTMTIGQLRDAARSARTDNGRAAAARAAAYEVEIQKKFALAFSCVVLAMAGVAIVLRFPRGRTGFALGAAGVVFTGYYLSLVTGESLADRQAISPFAAMWMANALLLAVVLLLAWPHGAGVAPARHPVE